MGLTRSYEAARTCPYKNIGRFTINACTDWLCYAYYTKRYLGKKVTSLILLITRRAFNYWEQLHAPSAFQYLNTTLILTNPTLPFRLFTQKVDGVYRLSYRALSMPMAMPAVIERAWAAAFRMVE